VTKEKSFLTLKPGDHVTKHFSSLPTKWQNKLEHSALATIPRLVSEAGAYPNGAPSGTLPALPTKYLSSLERLVGQTL
jgi:hypothetical protein